MEKHAARFISYLFHPLFIPFFTFLILLSLNTYFALLIPLKSRLILLGTVFLMTVILPLVITLFLYKQKLIRSVFLESREERIYPLLIITIFYYATYYVLKGLHISFLFSYYMLGATFLAILALIISFYWKISLHMIGMGGVFGLMMGLSLNFSMNILYPILAVTLVSGMVGFARLQENAHKSAEVYSGFLMGAVVMFFLFFLL
jgi:hypothetical protein